MAQAEVMRLFYESAFEQAATASAVIGSRGQVLKSNALYDELASVNGDKLAKAGERWKDLAQIVELNVPGNHSSKFQVQIAAFEHDGTSGKLVSLVRP